MRQLQDLLIDICCSEVAASGKMELSLRVAKSKSNLEELDTNTTINHHIWLHVFIVGPWSPTYGLTADVISMAD